MSQTPADEGETPFDFEVPLELITPERSIEPLEFSFEEDEEVEEGSIDDSATLTDTDSTTVTYSNFEVVTKSAFVAENIKSKLIHLQDYHAKVILDELETARSKYESAIRRLMNNELLFLENINEIKNLEKGFCVGQLDKLENSEVIVEKTDGKSITIDYEIVEKIGAGTFGDVFKIRHKRLPGLLRAAKVLKTRFLSSKRQLLEREAKFLVEASKFKHKNVIGFIEFSRSEQGKPLIIMELASETLRNRIEKHKENGSMFELNELFGIWVDVLNGLHHIHRLGIRHGDLKPSNICFSDDSQFTEDLNCAKILDFGISSFVTNASKRSGTFKFDAPEIYNLNAKNIDMMKLDIFSFGMVAADCVFLTLPAKIRVEYERQIRRIVSIFRRDENLVRRFDLKKEQVQFVKEHLKLLQLENKEIVPFIMKAIELDPLIRFQKVEKMLKEVHDIAIYSRHGLRKLEFSSWFKLPMVLEHNYAGYSRESVVFKFTDHFEFNYPEEHEQKYRELKKKLDKDLEEGKLYNSKIINPISFYHAQKEDSDERGIVITCCKTDYIHSKLMVMLFNTLDEEVKDGIRDRVCNSEIFPEFISSLGTHTGIITSDRKILFCRRSSKVQYSRNKYTCGAVETVDVQDIAKETENLDIFNACYRGLSEELGIDLPMHEIYQHVKLTGLMCKRTPLQMGFVGLIKLANTSFPHKTSFELAKFHTYSTGKDNWENKEWIFVDFSIESALGFLKEKQEFMTESGLCCAIFMLKHEFGNEKVDEKIFQMIKK